MRGIKKINKEMTLERLVEGFSLHQKEGNSAITFRVKLGVSEHIFRQWQKRFPDFDRLYVQARESERRVSFHGNKLGPSLSFFTNPKQPLEVAHDQ